VCLTDLEGLPVGGEGCGVKVVVMVMVGVRVSEWGGLPVPEDVQDQYQVGVSVGLHVAVPERDTVSPGGIVKDMLDDGERVAVEVHVGETV